MAEPEELSTAVYWDNRYRDEKTGWDLGAAPKWLEEKAQALSPRRVLVVGCGHGHDARAFAKAGHKVLGLDFSPRAIQAAQAMSGKFNPDALSYRLANVFDMGQGDLADLAQSFDLVWEQTCLCAIDPQRRPDYFKSLQRVLAPQGQWHAILWSHNQPGGPPFHLTPEIVETLIPQTFKRKSLQEIKDPEGSRPLQYLVEYSI